MQETTIPAHIMRLYDEYDRLTDIIYGDWTTEDARSVAIRERWAVEDALAANQA